MAPLAGEQLSAVTAELRPCGTGVPATPQQAKTRRWISSWKQNRVPTSSAAVSAMRSFQVPAVGLPLKAERACSGLKVPANGAVPPVMEAAAESSNTVGWPEQSLAPEP